MRRGLAAAAALALALFAAEEHWSAIEQQRQEIENQLQFVAAALRESPRRAREIAGLLGEGFAGARLTPRREGPSGAPGSIEVFRSEIDPHAAATLDCRTFPEEFAALVVGFERLLAAELRVGSASAEGGVVHATVEYDFVGPGRGVWRLERSGRWQMDWRKDDGAWHILKWIPAEQTRSVAAQPVFVDASYAALGDVAQLRQSLDYWRSVIDAAIGIGAPDESGISVGDIDGDGLDDFYVAQPAGLPNRLFRNQGDGTFRDVTEAAGVGVLDGTSMSLFADIDNDGDQDLIVITAGQPLLFLNDGRGRFQLARRGFQFAQGTGGEIDFDNDGRLDHFTLAPGRRAMLRRGAGDGFDRVAGAAGVDFENTRAFAIADFDQDGDPDIVLKSPGSPQVRFLRNDSRDGNASIAFRLTGAKSNRDAIGAVVTIETALGRQQRRLDLSPHSKELLFGLGRAKAIDRVTIEWPSGVRQTLRGVPVNHRIHVIEGGDRFQAEPFRPRNYSARVEPEAPSESSRPAYSGTWLYQPRRAPEFGDYRGRPLVVNFWATWCVPCRGELRSLQQNLGKLEAAGAALVTVATNEPQEVEAVRAYARREGFTFPVLLPEKAALAEYATFTNGIFEKTGEMGAPTTLLIDGAGAAVKIYRGAADVELILADLGRLNATPEERLWRAVPFSGIFVSPPR